MFKDLDFLEIGTSDFDTLLQSADDTTVGISVEPIARYLDNLPSRANVVKLNVAVMAASRDEVCEVYFVPEEAIASHNLPDYLRGCNSINGYHWQHTNLKIEHLVERHAVRQMHIAELLKEHNVRKINVLKIDTEGGDCYIMQDLFEYLQDKDVDFYPVNISFESNSLTDQNYVSMIIGLYQSIGYTLVSRSYTEDTVLKLDR